MKTVPILEKNKTAFRLICADLKLNPHAPRELVQNIVPHCGRIYYLLLRLREQKGGNSKCGKFEVFTRQRAGTKAMSGGPIDFAALRREREARRSGAAVLEQLVTANSVAKQTQIPDAFIQPANLLACSAEASRNNGICEVGARQDQNHTTRKHALKRLESSLKATTDIFRSELRARKVRTSCAAAYSHFCIFCDLCLCVRGSYMSCRAETGCDWKTLSTTSFKGAMQSRTTFQRLRPLVSCAAKCTKRF